MIYYARMIALSPHGLSIQTLKKGLAKKIDILDIQRELAAKELAQHHIAAERRTRISTGASLLAACAAFAVIRRKVKTVAHF